MLFNYFNFIIILYDSHKTAWGYELVNDYFTSQCTVFVLTPLQSTTVDSLSDVLFKDETILGLIRALNSNKSSGWDGIITSYDKNVRFFVCKTYKD